MKNIPFFLLFIISSSLSAQTISQKLQKAFQEFEADSQLKHAISSLYVIDAKTGKPVFDKNSQVGLAGASTQKIITATTAFELLGKDYRYKTNIYRSQFGVDLLGTGDPTFGSWRYPGTKDTAVFDEVLSQLKQEFKSGVKHFNIIENSYNDLLPSGWIYEDIGNYYGAKATRFIWNENQYNLVLIPGKKVGDPTEIDTVNSGLNVRSISNECKTGPLGSGDNAYIYFIPQSRLLTVHGTIPMGVKRFTISGADFDPECNFSFLFLAYAASKKIYTSDSGDCNVRPLFFDSEFSSAKPLYTHYSPPLDSIIYWFLKKSINLYGEALIKTFAYEKKGFGSTDSGIAIAIVKDFWKQKGLDEGELNIYDGSGLSPLNRLTTHAQVEVLKYAKTRDWFSYFYDALPEYNGMKMKSGTINDVKAFCGYQKSSDGNEYIFSFIVNNYNGYTSTLVNKMYRVLDELK